MYCTHRIKYFPNLFGGKASRVIDYSENFFLLMLQRTAISIFIYIKCSLHNCIIYAKD